MGLTIALAFAAPVQQVLALPFEAYSTPAFDTPTGDLGINDYALNEDASGYYIWDGKGVNNFSTVPLDTDVKGKNPVHIIGLAYYKIFGDGDRQLVSQQEYQGFKGSFPPSSGKTIFKSILEAAAAPIIFDNNATSTASSVSSLTYAHNVVSGYSSILIIKPTWSADAARTVSGVTYNAVNAPNVPITIAFNGLGQREQMNYLVNPTTGSNNVVVTFSTTVVQAWSSSDSYNCVDPTTPLGTAATTTGTGGSSNVSVTSAVGELVVDNFTVATHPAITAGAGQTERANFVSAARQSSGDSEKSATSTTAMSWSFSGSLLWAASAVPLKPCIASIPRVIMQGQNTIDGTGSIIIK